MPRPRPARSPARALRRRRPVPRGRRRRRARALHSRARARAPDSDGRARGAGTTGRPSSTRRTPPAVRAPRLPPRSPRTCRVWARRARRLRSFPRRRRGHRSTNLPSARSPGRARLSAREHCDAMTERDVTTSFARSLVDEWVRSGVTHAVVSPGSRNTPLLLALARDGRLRVDVVVDERSAGFRALGVGLATGRPAVVCCTSGTAAANLHPAVIEAHHARVPLLVCTADRPPELRDWGAGQTIDQTHLFGRAVRWFHDPGPPLASPNVDAQWRALPTRAVREPLGPPAGPVQLNLPFCEPLVPTGAPLVETCARAGVDARVRTTRGHATAEAE